jgi:hypothetical protein
LCRRFKKIGHREEVVVDEDEEAVGDCADVTADADRDTRAFCTRTYNIVEPGASGGFG